MRDRPRQPLPEEEGPGPGDHHGADRRGAGAARTAAAGPSPRPDELRRPERAEGAGPGAVDRVPRRPPKGGEWIVLVCHEGGRSDRGALRHGTVPGRGEWRKTDPGKRRTMGQVLVGTSGWVYPDWAGRFYPASPRSPAGSSATPNSFPDRRGERHLLPVADGAGGAAGGATQTPTTFRFVVKGSRYLTHMKRLTDTADGLRRFFERVEPLGECLDTVLVATPTEPASRSRSARRVPRPRCRLDVRHAVEFRHASWQVPEAYALLDRHGALLVVGERTAAARGPHRHRRRGVRPLPRPAAGLLLRLHRRRSATVGGLVAFATKWVCVLQQRHRRSRRRERAAGSRRCSRLEHDLRLRRLHHEAAVVVAHLRLDDDRRGSDVQRRAPPRARRRPARRRGSWSSTRWSRCPSRPRAGW